MQAFDLASGSADRERAARPYLEFLRVGSLSVGVYHLRAGQEDPQQPHSEDEVYHVLAGRASFRAGDRVESVGPGTILFVRRFEEHRFFGITEDLTALVFFAPAEGSLRTEAPGRPAGP
jgi:mannose-6-phosphate isomerase-like protein (cupin superfamily)